MSITPTYLVSCTGVFEQVKDPNLWKMAGATSLNGAKRIASKQASGTTYTARVAIQSADGEIKTIATLNNHSAITRTRAVWR